MKKTTTLGTAPTIDKHEWDAFLASIEAAAAEGPEQASDSDRATFCIKTFTVSCHGTAGAVKALAARLKKSGPKAAYSNPAPRKTPNRRNGETLPAAKFSWPVTAELLGDPESPEAGQDNAVAYMQAHGKTPVYATLKTGKALLVNIEACNLIPGHKLVVGRLWDGKTRNNPSGLTWSVTEPISGLCIGGGSHLTKDAALDSAKTAISRHDLDFVRGKIDEAIAIQQREVAA